MHENRAAMIGEKVMRLLEAMDDSESPEEQASYMADAFLALAASMSTLFIAMPIAPEKRIDALADIRHWLERYAKGSPDHA